MRTLIKQNSAALAAPCGTPRTGIIIPLRSVPACHYPRRTSYSSHFAAMKNFIHLTIARIRSLVKHKSERYFGMPFRNFIHFLYLHRIYSGRFFAHNVYSVFYGFYYISRVIIMRYGNYYGVYESRLQHFACVVKHGNIIMVFSLLFSFFEIFFCPFKSCGIYIRNRSYFYFRAKTVKNISEMPRTHISYTYNTCFYLISHYIYPPFIRNYISLITSLKELIAKANASELDPNENLPI